MINKKYQDLTYLNKEFCNAKPYPHIVLDNFIEKNIFQKITEDFELIDRNSGKNFNSTVENKKWISKNTDLPENLKNLIDYLNSNEWVKNISSLSGLKDIFSTRVGNTELANYHEMNKSGFLGSHVDHSSDPETDCPHVLNIIIYLTKKWDVKWGGSTTLLNSSGKTIIKEIEYIPNRAVIFLHTPYSFHGVKKLNQNQSIRSTVYVDYYSKSKNPYEHYDLDFSKKWFKHGTCFTLPSFIDYLKPQNFYYTKTKIDYYINKFIG